MTEHRPVIRHIATSFDGSVIAVAEFERHVQIWDVHSQHRIAAFGTTLDFGGTRLAISRDGRSCVVGAYHVHGIALYDASRGGELWRRKDLKRVQKIRVTIDDQRILCGFDGKSFQTLDLKNGCSEQSFRGVQDFWQSPYDPVIVLDRKGRDYKLATSQNKQIATISRTTFAALDFAFSPRKVCISESGGPVRCFQVTDGALLWQWEPGKGIHVLDLAYNEAQNRFAAITWPYQMGGDRRLVILDPDTGEARTIAPLAGADEHAFCCRGSLLVTSDGKLRDAATAEVLAVLDFSYKN